MQVLCKVQHKLLELQILSKWLGHRATNIDLHYKTVSNFLSNSCSFSQTMSVILYFRSSANMHILIFKDPSSLLIGEVDDSLAFVVTDTIRREDDL